MDIEAIKQGLSAFALAISTLKQAKDMLPDGKEKQDISDNVEKAERQLRIAEAQTAQGLGYELCKNHFPPEIMLSKNDFQWICSVCGNEKDKTPWTTIG